MKKILFLSAYDYSNCFNNIYVDSLYIAVPENDPAFGDTLKQKYKTIFRKNYFEISYGNDDLFSLIDRLKPDVLVSFGWRRIIKEEHINIIPLKINIHPAILPQYKGYHPLPYVLINNEREHGITAHLLTKELDAGDIIYMKTFPINSFSTVKSLQYLVNTLMPSFVKELLDLVESCNFSITTNSQEKTKIVAPKRTPDDSELDSRKSLDDLFNQIRACDSERFPAFFFKDGEKIYVTLSRSKDSQKQTPFDI